MLSSMCPLDDNAFILAVSRDYDGKGSKIVDMNFSDIGRQSGEEQAQSQEGTRKQIYEKFSFRNTVLH